MVRVERLPGGDDSLRFEVRIADGRGESRHEVTLSASDASRLGGEGTRAERLVEAAFRFLLDREAKESILTEFDVTEISRYFPEFEREIAGYLRK